jgi:hypothetical protein
MNTIDTAVPGPHALARSTDPATSAAAARTLRRHTTLAALLAAYAERPQGLTALEAATAAGLDPWQASKRVSDLLNGQLIAPAVDADGHDLCRRGTSGRLQRVLRITATGLDRWEGN